MAHEVKHHENAKIVEIKIKEAGSIFVESEKQLDNFIEKSKEITKGLEEAKKEIKKEGFPKDS